MRRQGSMKGKPAALALFALFALALLLALAAGARAYSALAAQADAVKDDRFATGLLVNSVRQADAVDAVSTASGPQGEALVLTERAHGGAFQTRIYRYDGMLMLEYAAQSAPFNPQTATPVLATESFWFTLEDGLLTIGTDQGTTCVALRSAQAEVLR